MSTQDDIATVEAGIETLKANTDGTADTTALDDAVRALKAAFPTEATDPVATEPTPEPAA